MSFSKAETYVEKLTLPKSDRTSCGDVGGKEAPGGGGATLGRRTAAPTWGTGLGGDSPPPMRHQCGNRLHHSHQCCEHELCNRSGASDGLRRRCRSCPSSLRAGAIFGTFSLPFSLLEPTHYVGGRRRTIKAP